MVLLHDQLRQGRCDERYRADKPNVITKGGLHHAGTLRLDPERRLGHGFPGRRDQTLPPRERDATAKDDHIRAEDVDDGDHRDGYGSSSTFGIKSYEAPSFGWSTAIFTANDQQPPVSLWFAGAKRQVRYNARVGGSEENPVVIRMILDLEGL